MATNSSLWNSWTVQGPRTRDHPVSLVHVLSHGCDPVINSLTIGEKILAVLLNSLVITSSLVLLLTV